MTHIAGKDYDYDDDQDEEMYEEGLGIVILQRHQMKYHFSM